MWTLLQQAFRHGERSQTTTQGPQRLRLLHLSDTHGMHVEIERRFPLPDADILLHTGDLTNHGEIEEFREVNKWFGTVKHRFRHILVIAGNHDLYSYHGQINLKEVLTNVTVLDHELAGAVLKDFGLQIYGSPWCAGKPCGNPGGEGHLFGKIPEGIDVLMTHGPPRGIFDTCGYTQSRNKIRCFRWGSSQDLNDAIWRARPHMHLFGHLHEQRGVWQRDSSGQFCGGVEYEAAPGQTFPTTGPPPHDWPCDVVSCNAMCNHGCHEEQATGHPTARHIAGPARLILATRNSERQSWNFDVCLGEERGETTAAFLLACFLAGLLSCSLVCLALG